MRLNQLSLINFKNHSRLDFDFSEDVIAVCGLNGQGKTNLLDAIHFLCVGKSYFSSTDVQCIKEGTEEGGVRAQIDESKLVLKLKRGSRKSIEKNGIPVKKLTEHLGQFFSIVISPGDIELVYGASKVRRSFVDRILSQTNKEYLTQLTAYTKLVEQRNRHLKMDNIDVGLLDVFDKQMAIHAAYIFEKRKTFFADFAPTYQENYKKLSGAEKVSLAYVSQLHNQDFILGCLQSRARDLASKRSCFGIHKDEIELELEGKLLRKYGSQGQIKSSLIALKLGEFQYISNQCDVIPILLLDDIFEKIDDKRASHLTQIIKKGNFGQIFITDTNKERLSQFCEQISKTHTSIDL